MARTFAAVLGVTEAVGHAGAAAAGRAERAYTLPPPLRPGGAAFVWVQDEASVARAAALTLHDTVRVALLPPADGCSPCSR